MEVRRWRRQVEEEDESSAGKKAMVFFRGRGSHPHSGRDRLNRKRRRKIRTKMSRMKLILKKCEMRCFKLLRMLKTSCLSCSSQLRHWGSLGLPRQFPIKVTENAENPWKLELLDARLFLLSYHIHTRQLCSEAKFTAPRRTPLQPPVTNQW